MSERLCADCLAAEYCRSALNLLHQAEKGGANGDKPLERNNMSDYLHSLSPHTERCIHPDKLQQAVRQVEIQYEFITTEETNNLPEN